MRKPLSPGLFFSFFVFSSPHLMTLLAERRMLSRKRGEIRDGAYGVFQEHRRLEIHV